MDRETLIGIIVMVCSFAFALIIALVVSHTLKMKKLRKDRYAKRVDPGEVVLETLTLSSGIKIEILKRGLGKSQADLGHTVTVHYKGWLTDGTMFDSSRKRAQPYSFRLGMGRVISGWEIGIQGMRPGEVRRLTIPPKFGYGETTNGMIPGNSTLIFEVELLSISKGGGNPG